MEIPWRRSRSLVAVVGLGVALVATAARAMDAPESDGSQPLTGTPVRMSGTSSIFIKRYGADTLIPHERNVSFRFFRGVTPMLLLREEIDVEDEVPWKGEGWATASVDLTARAVGKDGKAGAIRYRIHENGEGALLYGPLYVVSMEGCCDSQDGHVVYSVQTGKRLMYTTGRTPVGALESLRLPKSGARSVGAYAANSAYDQAVFAGSGDTLAVVTYATDDAPLMRVVVTRPGHPHESPPYFDRLEVRRSPQKAGEEPSVTVHVQFFDDVYVDLPVVDDALDVAHATCSDGLTVRKAPLDGLL
jgi:hypothetical protein